MLTANAQTEQTETGTVLQTNSLSLFTVKLADALDVIEKSGLMLLLLNFSATIQQAK